MSRYIDAEPRYVDADSLKQKWLFRGKDGKPYRDEIDAMPTADVAPVVHGEWKDKEVFDNTDEDFVWKIKEWQSARCSVCEKYHTTPYMYYFDNFKYCPFCGARMDGEA